MFNEFDLWFFFIEKIDYLVGVLISVKYFRWDFKYYLFSVCIIVI